MSCASQVSIKTQENHDSHKVTEIYFSVLLDKQHQGTQ